jgi:hypothetical protein
MVKRLKRQVEKKTTNDHGTREMYQLSNTAKAKLSVGGKKKKMHHVNTLHDECRGVAGRAKAKKVKSKHDNEH